MNLLLVGGAGYVGSSVGTVLKDRGHQLWVLDDLSTGHRENVGKIARGFTYARAGDRDAVRALFRREKFDGVFHFAASALVEESVRNPQKYFENNVTQTQFLIEEMLAAGVRHFVFSSTCAIFGDPGDRPISEDLPKNPINPYGESKKAAEEMIARFCREKGLRATALRYFNAAGADPQTRVGENHEPETHLIPNVFRAVNAGKSVRVFGTDYPTLDGTCVRDYIHVADLADAHEKAFLRMRELPGSDGSFDVYNLGTEQGYTVKQVIAECERVLGRQISVELAPRRPGDPPKLFADASKARRDLGFQIRYPLASIIETAWSWEQKRLKPGRAVFLDRDGTLNEDPGYLNHPAQMKLLPGVGEALSRLQDAGYRLAVVSNQSGVGRGLIEPETLPLIHDRMDELLKAYGVKLHAYVCCVHRPEEGCECRKPKPRLLLDAASQLGADLSRSYMVGDKASDLEAGRLAGCRGSVLVRTGDGQKTEESGVRADQVADDLAGAVAWILDQKA